MIIWKAETDEETKYFEKKGEAGGYLRDYRKSKGSRKAGTGPTKVSIRGRAELVAILNGYAPYAAPASGDNDVNEDEFI